MPRPVILLLGSALAVAACSNSPTGPNGPAAVSFVTTNPTGTPGWLLGDSLEVRVTTSRGAPAAGSWVHWSATAEGALFSDDSTMTGSDGIARVDYTPGWTLGPQQVDAMVGGQVATIAVQATGMELTATEVLDRRACGLDTDGRMWCWPEYANEVHPLRLDAARRPLPVATTLRFVALRSHGYGYDEHGLLCGITADGQLWCAAEDDFSGPHGTAASVPTLHQVQTPAPVADYALGGGNLRRTECFLDTSGNAWCRGDNFWGQLGDGTTTASTTWQPVGGNLRFLEITVGDHDACAIALDGEPYCWGGNTNSRLGITPATFALTTPTAVDGDIRLKRITQASSGLCGIAAFQSPDLLCWGPTFPAHRINPIAPSGIEDVPTTATSLGGDWAGGRIVNDGRLYRFGYNGGWTADYEFYNRIVVPDLTGIDRLVSRTSYYWCVRHASGSTICSTVDDRPVAVPLPE